MIPAEHQAFVEELLSEHGVPPLPDDLQTGVVKAAGLGVDEEGPGQVEVALSHPVSMVVNALGPPPQYVVEQAHERGILVGGLVGNRQHAERQVAQGTDVIVAQGTEAGGHCGDVSTMVLVPEVVDAVGPDVPVLAAGGIGRGRQMAAAMALGAAGVWTGSIWLTVAENESSGVVSEKLLAATSSDTVRSRAFTGKPARQLRTAWTEAWEAPDSPGTLPMPLQFILNAYANRKMGANPPKELVGMPVGQIVSRMNQVRSSRQVVFDMMQEYADVVETLG
jgi:NAD(P)H-dependent flavin oxidoreductase YrpB (nitropropane dioxygenase family)